MRILLINLTRLGDLLQMQPLIHTLHTQGHCVDIVCLENFQEAAYMLQGIQEVLPFRSSRTLALASKDWPSAIAFLEASLEDILCRTKYERIINMTASKAARLLALRLATHETQIDGYIIDPKTLKPSSDPWGIFFEAASTNRICSPFNLIDVFSKSIRAFSPTNQNKLLQPDIHDVQGMHNALMQSLTSDDRAVCRGFVAIQLGASVAMRQWPSEAFAALGQQVWKEHALMPVLVGSPNEQILATKYLETGAPATNYVGKTSLKALAHLLCCTKILLTNDTGTMHLAAGLNIPCLAFFLGTAQPWDTGPASTNSCCLEPAIACHPCSYTTQCSHNYKCQQQIKAEHVWPLLHTWIQTGTWQSCTALNKVARVWKNLQDDTGYKNIHSLSGHESQDRTLWLRLQHHIYSQFFDFLQNPAEKSTLKINAYQHTQYPFSQTWCTTIRPSIHQSIQLCQALLKQGISLQRQENPTNQKHFQANIQTVHTLLKTLSPLGVFALIWQINLQDTTETYAKNCSFIKHFIRLLQSCAASLTSNGADNGTKNA